MVTWRILQGDVCERLASLPAESVQTCVTSPPYWGLRDYGHAGQIGLEPTPSAFVTRLVEVFAEVHRVLREDGTLWLNLGDSYANTGAADSSKVGGFTGARIRAGAKGIMDSRPRKIPEGIKPKDLVGIPWMVAFALRDYGWYLRSEIIWHKPNPMPESVTDRPTKSHEQIFLFSKSARYYYDADAIKEESAGRTDMGRMNRPGRLNEGGQWRTLEPIEKHERNKRSVWTVATQAYEGAHFATYPEALIEPCILAGSKPGDLVLDPFTGSGTTGAVAIRHKRSFVGTELNPAYIELARKRIGNVAPLLASEVA